MSTPAKTSLKEFYVLLYVTGEPGLNQNGILIDFMFWYEIDCEPGDTDRTVI